MTDDSEATSDAVTRYGTAAETGDNKELVRTLSPDVELRSPISGRLRFVGRDDVALLLDNVYDLVDNLSWKHEIGDRQLRVLVGRAQIWRLPLTDAMVFELASDGRIKRITPHLRPWLGLSLLALMLAGRLARHPRMLLRAWRHGRRP